MAVGRPPSCTIARLIVVIYLSLFIAGVAGDSDAKTSKSTNHSNHKGKVRRESISEIGAEEEPEMRQQPEALGIRAAAGNKTLPEPEASESSNSETTAKNDQVELEKLVRSQVDFAASDWATLSPMEHQANLNEHIEQLNLLSSAYNRGAKLLMAEEDHHQQVDGNKKQQEHRQFYPNHNYQYDRESSEPFKYSAGQPDAVGKTQTTTDPMTTSSDGSNRYESHVPQPAYMYRLRGPITSSDSSESSSQQNARRLWYATSSTTLAPKIMLAFQRLDKQRNSSSDNELPPSSNGNSNRRHETNKHPFRNSMSSSNRVNLISQSSQQLSAQGFVDEPTLQIVSNGQQPPMSPSSAASADDPTATGRRDQQQRTQYIRNEPQKAPATPSPAYFHRLDGGGTNSSLRQQQQSDKNKSLLEFLSSVHDIQQTQTTTPRISPQDLASNLHGNLAARLSANRYKSSHRKFTAKPTTQSSDGHVEDGGGGTKESQAIQNNGNGRAQPLSVSFMGNDYATATTSGPDELAGSATSSPPQTTDPSTRTTTTNSRSTPTAGSRPPWRQTTIPLSSATSNPNLFAENSNELAVANGDLKNLNAAAHHHHLHSHVHSIKPAVITIPIQQQSLASSGSSMDSPRFNPYEGIVAAAAAAAAAATATAKARPLQASAARQPAPAYPLSIQQQQVKSSLRPLRKQSVAVSRKFHHNHAPSIPIGGTLASAMQQHHQQQQQNQQQYQSSSILGQLLESANRALKHVTGQQQQQQQVQVQKGVALQTAGSNQATPVHSDPNQLRLFSSIINQRANGNPHQLLLNPFLLAGSAAAAENFAELTAAAENSPPQSAVESVGLFQAPIDSTGSPMDAYLASLISSSSSFADLKDHSAGVFHTLVGPKNDSLKSASSLQEDWDSSSSNNSSAASGSGDFPAGNVVFASLGDDSNLLYPIYSSSTGSMGSSSDQSETVTLDADGAAGLKLLDDEGVQFGFHPAGLAADSQSNEQIWSIPIEFNQLAQNHLNSSSSHAGGRKQSGRKTNKSVNNKAKLKKVAVIRRPHTGLGKSPNSKGPAGEMQYALAHYMNSDSIEPGSAHLGDLAPGDKTLVAYDVFDDHNNKLAAKFSQPVSSSSSQTADAFRPITHPHYYSPYLGDALRGPSYGGIDEAATAAIRGAGGRYPRGQSHQSQQQSHHHLSPDTSGIGNNKGNASSEITTTSVSLLNGPGNLFYSPASFLSAAWPHHQLLAAAALQHPSSQHHRHPSQPPLWPASSSHRPHVSAALDWSLLNARALHQLLHGGGGGGHHDLATSETARLTSSFGAPAAIGRTAMLLHFWPIALALLPVMIIVAIVAQLIMAAPLVLFAFTTLTVSRLLAPLNANRRELDSPSAASSIKLLQDSAATLMPNGTSPGLLGSLFRGGSAPIRLSGNSDKHPKRNSSDTVGEADRKRPKRAAAAAASDLDEYIESLVLKFS